MTKLILKPIELGFGKSERFVGLPFEADSNVAREIYEWYAEISKGYGTRMTLQSGIIEVELNTACG